MILSHCVSIPKALTHSLSRLSQWLLLNILDPKDIRTTKKMYLLSFYILSGSYWKIGSAIYVVCLNYVCIDLIKTPFSSGIFLSFTYVYANVDGWLYLLGIET